MWPRQCPKCGTRFITTDKRRKFCDTCADSSNRSRTVDRIQHNLQFIGVDGEGVNRPDGTHEYVLLSVGQRSLYKSDGARLTFYDIMPFLWECFLANPNTVFVGFYLGYDFACWLRDLPEHRARMLLDNDQIDKRRRTKSGKNHTPFPVKHRGWCFDILPMKRWRMWKEGSAKRLYICDTGAFFQSSFLKVINPEQWPDGPVCTDSHYKLVSIGKEHRGTEFVPYGTPVSDEMIEYNLLENDILSRLMKRYNEGLVHVGIRLKKDQWFGPGQAAQTWMGNISAPTREEFENVCATEIRRKLRYSYYGGWFEIFAHGHIPGTSYSYDINSAYPDIQSRLPCCLHGQWTTGTGMGPCDLDGHNTPSYLLVSATVIGTSSYCGSAPHRLRTGHILRPNQTKGWYWWHELNAAKQARLIDEIIVHEWIRYLPCDCEPPFRAERQLYEDRLRVGKSTIAGKARRLVYNSAYGKTAQSIGTAKYANPFYASLITSHCRTRILESISTHPKGITDVLMVATDGITFRHHHTNLICDDSLLGAWSQTTHQNLTLFMPGVYWDDRTRNKLSSGEAPSLKSRGISGKSLATRIQTIDQAFNEPHSGNGLPQIDIPINFSIVSPKQALARRKWETCGLVEFNTTRTINADPTMKRTGLHIDNDIVRSVCYQQAPTLESTPYNKTFGDEQQKELDTILTPEGTIDMILPEALK